ncbi:hypothetical protein [Shewanella khirikhana]|uniref:hypothetical protein n=1 Tax=Shewanella khirikhana TaxID=1965282 RepID=UPI000F7E76A4|nr:hypothetical protein [Shewanella khirikhana]
MMSRFNFIVIPSVVIIFVLQMLYLQLKCTVLLFPIHTLIASIISFGYNKPNQRPNGPAARLRAIKKHTGNTQGKQHKSLISQFKNRLSAQAK